MTKLSIIIGLLLQIVLCQTSQLNSASQKVIESYEQLKLNPNDNNTQLNYIKSFPQNWTAFLNVFQPHDLKQLYPKYFEYIGVLDSIQVNYPKEVGTLLIKLAINAKWDADATGDIQHILASFAASKTFIFSKLLSKRTASEKQNVIKYLADVENHDSYSEYQTIITTLKTIKQYQLAKRFEDSRQLRMKKEH